MDVVDRLRQEIEEQERAVCLRVPMDREAAILAIVRAWDALPFPPRSSDEPDPISGRRLINPGGGTALRLVFTCTDPAEVGSADPGDDLCGWADRFLDDCGFLADASRVLGHAESGAMRISEEPDQSLSAWLAAKRAPAAWRERADLNWWSDALAARYAPEIEMLCAHCPEAGGSAETRSERGRRLADVHLATMAYQLSFPAEAEIGGCSIGTYRAVLALLMTRVLRPQGDGEPATVLSEWELVSDVAVELGLDPVTAEAALDAFTLDGSNAAYHAMPPGVAAAPIVRIGPDRVVLSRFGLLTEPLFFLARELRRRDSETYNNVAVLREEAFRRDLYSLFSDKRFVTSPNRIELRREGGDLRTDIDAAVFDRKTGTLALFELKAQDPFARSAAELARQLDNLLYANRQVSGVLAWVQRYGGDVLLSRIDYQVAKQFRVQKVLPFVLGRSLVPAGEGGAPLDPRAAWTTWPQLLRLLDGQRVTELPGSPLATLHARLRDSSSDWDVPVSTPTRSVELGETRLTVYPSQAGYRAFGP